MSNHFHLVVETPQPNLVAGMKWFLGVYTARYNRRHKEFGHLFSVRYKSLIVDGSGNGYLKSVCDYVHLNPVRANLLKAHQRLADYQWSSFCLYLNAPSQRPGWLRTDRLLGEWFIPKDSAAGRGAFAERVEQRRVEDLNAIFKTVERGWYLGSEEFKKELLEQVTTTPGGSHFGEIVHEAAELTAEKILQCDLKKMRWSDADLSARRKGDPGKVRLALQLRAQTTMSLEWIATRLQMGTRGYVTWLLQRARTHNKVKSRI